MNWIFRRMFKVFTIILRFRVSKTPKHIILVKWNFGKGWPRHQGLEARKMVAWPRTEACWPWWFGSWPHMGSLRVRLDRAPFKRAQLLFGLAVWSDFTWSWKIVLLAFQRHQNRVIWSLGSSLSSAKLLMIWNCHGSSFHFVYALKSLKPVKLLETINSCKCLWKHLYHLKSLLKTYQIYIENGQKYDLITRCSYLKHYYFWKFCQ